MRADKKHGLLARAVLLCFLSVLLGSPSGFSAAIKDGLSESGIVVHIADGDTVTVKFANGAERRVRLIGVDAPEMDDPREDEAFRAFLSKRFAFHHLYRRDVRLTYDFAPLDEHGRVLAYVWSEGERLFNDFIIRQGFAAAFLKYPFRKDYQARFRAAEADARKDNRGFWRREAPPVISVSEVRSRLGEVVSIRFRCAEISQKKAFLYLRSEAGAFEALTPLNRISLFPGIESGEGREIIATGFLEEFRGRPQIMLFFSRQLRLT